MQVLKMVTVVGAILGGLSRSTTPGEAHALTSVALPAKAALKLYVHKTGITGRVPGLSGAQSNYVQTVKAVVTQGYRSGQFYSGGGMISSGLISGTGYYNEVIGGSNTFINSGFNQFALGSNAANTGPGAIFSSSGNYVNFQVSQKLVPVIVTNIGGMHISGATSAYLSSYATAGYGGFIKGLSGGKLAGGEFYGTIFSNTNVPPSTYFGEANYALTFGRSPLNSGALGNTITVPNQNGYIIYPDGVVSSVTRGLFAGTFNGPAINTFAPGPNSSQYSLFAIGASPFNTNGPETFMFGKTPESRLFLKYLSGFIK